MNNSHDRSNQHLLVPGDPDTNQPAGESYPSRSWSPVSSITLTGDRLDGTSASTASIRRPKSTIRDAPQVASSRTSKGLWQWWPEIVAAATSIAFFAALVAVLIYIDGTTQDRWKMPWQIKPSAVISVLITISQMALTPIIGEGISQLKWVFFEQRPQKLSEFQSFDEASRGPLGAAQFIYKLNWRASLASAGALFAVLALGMGPFTQQVLYTADLQTNTSNGLALIGAASHYNSGSTQAMVQGGGLDGPVYHASATKSGEVASSTTTEGAYLVAGPGESPSAFQDSIYSSAHPSSTSAATATSTLATLRPRKRDESNDSDHAGRTACAESRMIRAAYGGLYNSNTQATFTCSSGNCTWPSFSSLGICSDCEDISNKVESDCIGKSGKSHDKCFYNLPAGEIFAKNDNLGLEATSNCGSSSGKPQLWGTSWQSRLAAFSLNETALLAKFYSLQLPTDYVTMGSCQIPKPVVRKCSISWCRKTYQQTNSTNGVLLDLPTQRSSLVAFDPTNTTCTSLQDLAVPSSDVAWKGLINADRSCPASKDDVADDNVFWVNSVDHDMTSNMFSLMFKNQELVPGDTNSSMNIAQIATLQAFLDNNDGDFAKTLAQSATGMTNYIRRSDGSKQVMGVTTTTTTIYRVSWPWLVYPLVVLVCALVFFIWTIFLSKEKSRIVWKSSALAILAHGIDGDVDDEFDSNNLKGMGKESKGFRAQLQKNEEGKLKLVKF